MKRLDIITNVGYIQESLEHSEWKGLNKEQTALEIKKIIDEVVRLVSKNESLHLVGVREFECDDVVCTNDGKMWVITEIDGDDVLVTGNGKKDYPLEKSDITHAH